MPSRKSPSQRAFGARVARALFLEGSHSGRVASAAPAALMAPSVPAVVPASPGASITPGGQRVVDIVWPTAQVFAGSGVVVDTADNWSPSSGTDAATATEVSGDQILLCTDGVEATYHVTLEPHFYLSTFVGSATQFAVYATLSGWFGYVQAGPPPGGSATDFTRYTFSGFKHCSPGEAINAFDLAVRVLDDAGNSYRVSSDNAAMTITRMPA